MPLLAAPPDVLHWCPRSQGHGDCAVAALQLACGVTYEAVLAEAVQIVPTVLTDGLTWREIQKVAKRLGFRTHLLRTWTFPLDDVTGILNVYQAAHRKESDHVVYLWEGRVVEPAYDRQQLWLDPQMFLSHYHYSMGGLLTLTRKEDPHE